MEKLITNAEIGKIYDLRPIPFKAVDGKIYSILTVPAGHRNGMFRHHVAILEDKPIRVKVVEKNISNHKNWIKVMLIKGGNVKVAEIAKRPYIPKSGKAPRILDGNITTLNRIYGVIDKRFIVQARAK